MTDPLRPPDTDDEPWDHPVQRGPNTYRMDAPSDVTTWAVIRTTRTVATPDGRGMEARAEWWEVPSFVVDSLRPPDTDDEPWDAFYRALDDRERLRRDRSRDLALLAFAGLVLLALLAWGMTTPWNT